MLIPGHENLTLYKGYQLKLLYSIASMNIEGYEIRFRISGINNGADYDATEVGGNIIDVIQSAPASWTILLTGVITDAFEEGQYSYALALKAPGEDYEPYITGALRVIDLEKTE